MQPVVQLISFLSRNGANFLNESLLEKVIRISGYAFEEKTAIANLELETLPNMITDYAR